MDITARLDHLIVNVNDIDQSVRFWADILGFKPEGTDGPFTVMRLCDDLIFLFAPWGTEGGSHYAFSLGPAEFDRVFDHIRENAIPFGDSFHNVGTQTGPGVEFGARGNGRTLYFNDPNSHLLEIRTYE